MKILYFDTETTGLFPEKNALIQLSGIIEIDGQIKERFNFRLAPFKTDIVEPDALKVTGLTVEQIVAFPDPFATYKQIVALFDRYIDKYDRSDKFFPAGYNVRFDIDFLAAFFKKNGNPYFGSYCNWHGIDGLALMHYMEFIGALRLDNYKLATLCKHFGIEISAHDAFSDIAATRELIGRIKNTLQVIKTT